MMWSSTPLIWSLAAGFLGSVLGQPAGKQRHPSSLEVTIAWTRFSASLWKDFPHLQKTFPQKTSLLFLEKKKEISTFLSLSKKLLNDLVKYSSAGSFRPPPVCHQDQLSLWSDVYSTPERERWVTSAKLLKAWNNQQNCRKRCFTLWFVNGVTVHALWTYSFFLFFLFFALSLCHILFSNWILTCWRVSKGKLNLIF